MSYALLAITIVQYYHKIHYLDNFTPLIYSKLGLEMRYISTALYFNLPKDVVSNELH